jgi:hypothetical protein
MDQWRPIDETEDGLWVIYREMYTSVLVCVSNRTVLPATVLVDCSLARQWDVMATERDRVPGTSRVIERTVDGNTTAVVCVLTSSGTPLSFDVSTIMVHRTTVLKHTSTSQDDVIASAEATSVDVSSWLESRRKH